MIYVIQSIALGYQIKATLAYHRTEKISFGLIDKHLNCCGCRVDPKTLRHYQARRRRFDFRGRTQAQLEKQSQQSGSDRNGGPGS
jgi:hypothetical protein